MFQNSRISIILRIICLIAFMLVIILNNSFITLVLLTIFFYAFTRNERGSLIFWLRILMIISFLISYFTGYLPLLKLVLIIGLAYYFIIDPYKENSIRK